MSELTLSPEFAIPSTATCPWMDHAMQEMGTREKAGARSNPEVVKYLASCDGRFGGDLDNEETDWCSAFVNWCLAQASIIGTNNVRARSWIRWGLGFRINEPRFGAIAVFTRTRDHSLAQRGKGHVAFVWRKIGTRIHLLGGNQNNRVKIKDYAEGDLLVYMWPNQTFTLPPRGPLSPGYLTPPEQIIF